MPTHPGPRESSSPKIPRPTRAAGLLHEDFCPACERADDGAWARRFVRSDQRIAAFRKSQRRRKLVEEFFGWAASSAWRDPHKVCATPFFAGFTSSSGSVLMYFSPVATPRNSASTP
jgi:hypothetical protein